MSNYDTYMRYLVGMGVKPDYTEPFYLEDLSGAENIVSIKKQNDELAPTLTVYKSSDGVEWSLMGYTSVEGITATIPAYGKLYLRCSTNSWGWTNGSVVSYNYIDATGTYKASGSIMPLLYGQDYDGTQTALKGDASFLSLFQNSTTLSDISGLILPSTSMRLSAYAHMFQGTSITTAPELPATTLANHCYEMMFYNCKSLTQSPDLMYEGELLPQCYSQIFGGCSNLNYIKCMGTPNGTATMYWVNGVSATGTFVKKNGVEWNTGLSGIPNGWTVINK